MAIAEIKLGDERQRKGIGTINGKDPEDQKKVKTRLEDLAGSIKTNGMLQPIGVTTTNELLYGFRRLQAAIMLGWTHVPVVIDPERTLNELDKEIIELDENLQRLDLSMHERAAAIAKVNQIRQKQDPTWTQRKTAVELNISQRDVSIAEKMAPLFELFPDLKKAKSLAAALSQAKAKAGQVIRKHEVKSNPAKYEEVGKKVACMKCEEWILTQADESFSHIITDGPFGIDYDKRLAGTEGAHEAYDDSPEEYRRRTEILGEHMFRVLKPNAFLVWFLAHDHFEWTKKFLGNGFSVDPVPIIWDRSDGRCYSTRPDKYFGKGYDIALHCTKGDPQMVIRSRSKGKHGSGNVFRYPPVAVNEKEHIVERPIELYQDIIQCLTLEGERILDLFAGSGKIAAAAASLRRDHYSVEVNPNHIPTIVRNVYSNTPQSG